MAKRFDLSDVNIDGDHVFKAKYDGVCGLCCRSIDKGEECHMVYGKAAHATCHPIARNGGHSSKDFEDRESDREPSYVVKGARQPPYCGTCFQYHNGECP